MTDSEILKGIKKYFDIRELVGKSTYSKHGQGAWKFLDFRLLKALLIIREGIDKPISSNNWFKGGQFSQRGLRTNVQQIFKGLFRKGILYLSGHVLGKAIDFDVEGMKAEEVRQWIKDNEHLFQFKIRLEKNVTWVHLDVIQDESKPKIYEFNV